MRDYRCVNGWQAFPELVRDSEHGRCGPLYRGIAQTPDADRQTVVEIVWNKDGRILSPEHQMQLGTPNSEARGPFELTEAPDVADFL